MTKRAKKAKALRKTKKMSAGQRAKPDQRPAKVERDAQKESLDTGTLDVVECSQPVMMPAVQGGKAMTLTLKKLNKKGTQAIYSGLRASVRIMLANFEGRQPPQTFEVVGPLVGVAQRKPKRTAEEQKALRAAQPKPTLAERATRARTRADKLAAAAAAELQPAM